MIQEPCPPSALPQGPQIVTSGGDAVIELGPFLQQLMATSKLLRETLGVGSELYLDIKYFSSVSDSYETILDYTVPPGKKLHLSEVSIAPDTNCTTNGYFKIEIGDSIKMEGIRLLTSVTLNYRWTELKAGQKIKVEIKTDDVTVTVAGNVVANGRLLPL